jgi:hypothetical protein
MRLLKFILYLALTGFIISCNTTEQKKLGQEKSSDATTSVKSASFIYNISKIVLTENTTSARFNPVARFEGAFFRILPSLPAGLVLNTSTGEISGTPTETLTETQFLVEVDTVDGFEYAFLNITVLDEAPKSLSYDSSTIIFDKGLINSYTPTTTGGAITQFSVTPALPNGLVLNATTGAIETVESAPGVVLTEPISSFHTITASNTTGSFSTTVLVHIKDAPPVGLTYITASQDFIIGVSATFNSMVPTFSATDPTPISQNYSISPALPNGLQLLADGSIQGTPEEPINLSSFTITVTNESGSSSTIVNIQVTKPALSLSYPNSSTAYEVEQDVSMAPILLESYQGGTPPVFSASNCSFDPAGIAPNAAVVCSTSWLKVDPVTGLLSGTPDAVGVFTVDITATHPDNSSGLVGTPAAPVESLTFNISQNAPSDPNKIGYKDSYELTENLRTTITPIYVGGAPTAFSLNTGEIVKGADSGGVDLAITSGIASFTANLSTDVGPGKAIHYNDGVTDKAVFIRSRINDSTFEVFENGFGGSVENGLGNNLTVSLGTTATFSSAVNTNIIAGHILQYDSNNDGSIDAFAEITIVNSSTDFTVQAVGGGAATNTSEPDQDWKVNFSSGVANLAATQDWSINDSLPSGISFINGVISGTPNLNLNGSSTCTSSTATTFPLEINGFNEDESGTLTLSGTQSVTLNIQAVAPKRLGYTEGRSGTFFQDGIFKLVDGSGIDTKDIIRPNGYSGGSPNYFSISPRLPSGLIFDSCTGSIYGTPQEITPVKNYTIKATNNAGTFSETIALSTNNLTAPQSIVYNDLDGNCAVDAADNQIAATIFTPLAPIEPCYRGSKGSFTITPDLPAGLSINRYTGEIFGTPLFTQDEVLNFTVRSTNILGFIETTITLTISNTPLIPTDISLEYDGQFLDTSTLGTLILTEDEIINPGDIAIEVATNSTLQSGLPTSFFASIEALGPITQNFVTNGSDPKLFAGANETLNLIINPVDGNFSTYFDTNGQSLGIAPTNPRHLDPEAETITLFLNNNAGTAVEEVGSAANTLTIAAGTLSSAGIPVTDSPPVGSVLRFDSDSNGSIDAVAIVAGSVTPTSFDIINLNNTNVSAIAANVNWTLENSSGTILSKGSVGNELTITAGTNSIATASSSTGTIAINSILSYGTNGDDVMDSKVKVVSTPGALAFQVQNLDGSIVSTQALTDNWIVHTPVTKEFSLLVNEKPLDFSYDSGSDTINIIPDKTIGDLIRYHSSGDVTSDIDSQVHIHSKIDDLNYGVVQVNGGKVTDLTLSNNQSWFMTETVASGSTGTTISVVNPSITFSSATSLEVGNTIYYDSNNDNTYDAEAVITGVTTPLQTYTVAIKYTNAAATNSTSAVESEWFVSNTNTDPASDVTITSTTAAFAPAVTNPPILGDIIYYDSDATGGLDSAAIITGITVSGTSYSITSLEGGNAKATGAPISEWEVVRPSNPGSELTIKNNIASFTVAPTNTINLFSGADLNTGSADHIGGAVALSADNPSALKDLCFAELISASNIPTGASLSDADLLQVANSGLSLDPATCNIQYTGSTCASDVTSGIFSTGNNTLEYRIRAYNSGSPGDPDASPKTGGFTRNVTVNYFDQPNFLFEPDASFTKVKYSPKSTYIESETDEFRPHLNLTLSGNTIGDSGAPSIAGKCHKGDFNLNLLSDLPSTFFPFNSTDGSVRVANKAIFGRRNFELFSTDNSSGTFLTKSENISIQANHTLDIVTGEAERELYATKFDFNLDGLDDLVIRSRQCEDRDGDGNSDGACAGVETSIYTQSAGTPGLLRDHSNSFPLFEAQDAISLAPVQYDTAETGIIYTEDNAGTMEINAISITSGTVKVAVAANQVAMHSLAIIPFNEGSITSFGILYADPALTAVGNTPITIDQYEVNTDLDIQLFPGPKIPTRTVANHLNGGIELGVGGSVEIVTQNDTDGDGNLDIVIGYTNTNEGSFVCVLKNDGANFAETCNPRIPVQNNGKIKDIKFANISNDSLDEMFILSNDGVNNSIDVQENQNQTGLAGDYQSIDQVTLKTLPTHLLSFANFDLTDANNDGFIDIVAADVNGDIDKDAIAGDGVISGLTVYYNSNNSTDIFPDNLSDEFGNILHYPKSAGNTNEVEILDFSGTKLIFHCQIDLDDTTTDPDGAGPLTLLRTTSGKSLTDEQNSSCGIIGSF